MDDRARFRRVEEVFRGACGLEGEARARFLNEACAGDEGLRREVEALLAEDERPLIGEPEGIGARSDEEVAASSAPEVEGYAIVGVLGVGGMGIVYEAEQARPARRVALKVLRPGLATRERLRRFELEGEVLARLSHPSIAQVYGVGLTGDGRPYFAMQLVEGRALTRHVEEAGLGTRERLELFLEVCEAVEHAHARGVIHRDLKPSNILVTGEGRVKVLDFGIARATDSDVAVTTVRTDVGQLLGTLAYMSPEQASGDPRRIDVRSDVYSLAVLLFEMLAGRRPRELEGLAFAEAIRTVQEGEPTRLGSVDRALRGDLETIVGKGLERDPSRRYATAGSLAEDVRRHLRSEPITARPPSTVYQMRKFARRNRGLVGGVGAVFVVLVVALVVVSLALAEAQSARRDAERAEGLARERLGESERALEEARRQRRIAEAVNAFVNEDLLAAADPILNPTEGEMTVREALDAAARSVEGRFEEEPLVEAAVRMTIGLTYVGLGRYEDAAEHGRRAAEIRRERLGARDAGTLEAEYLVGVSRYYHGELEAAEPVLERVAAARREILGEEDPATIESVAELGMLRADMGRLEEAAPLLEEAVEVGRRVLGMESDQVLFAADGLAGLRYRQLRFEEAASLYREVLEARRGLTGEGAEVDTIATMSSLALTLQRLGRLEESEALGREAVDSYVRVLGEEHPYTQTARTNLGLLYIQMERFEEAERLIRGVYDLRMATLGEGHPETLVSTTLLGRTLATSGRYEEAEPLLVGAAERFTEVRGADHPFTRVAVEQTARLYEAWGKPEEAARWRARLGEEGQ